MLSALGNTKASDFVETGSSAALNYLPALGP